MMLRPRLATLFCAATSLVVLNGCAMSGMQPAPASIQQSQQQVVAQPQLQQLPTQTPPQQNFWAGQPPAPQTPQPMMMAPQQPSAQNPAFGLYQQALGELDAIRDRLRRTERAMIRLDRRMQLIERQELSRMSDIGSVSDNAAQNNVMPNNSLGIGPSMAQGGANQAGGQFMPMRLQITEPLAASSNLAGRSVIGAPNLNGREFISAPGSAAAPSAMSSLPSISDQGGTDMPAKDIEIWSIRYQDGKVWPARDELLNSGNVVSVLRSDAPVTLFARSGSPTSRQFRDRVRALSQYLGQVSDRDSIPIATLPADGLRSDVIELVVVR